MKRASKLLVVLSVVVIPALTGLGIDIGARLSVQPPSLAIQAEWNVSPDLTMGLLVETSLDPIFNPGVAQTPSIRIGLQAKYRFTLIHPAFVPYLGVVGSLGLSGAETTIAVDVLAGARIYITQNVHLFAEAAFSMVPLPDAATWTSPASFYKSLYLGFGIRL